jgi:hypothetical protein
MKDELTPEEAKALADAQLRIDGPVAFVWRFMVALREGRIDDARSCLEGELASSELPVGEFNFALGPGWGLYGVTEVTDEGDEVVSFVETGSEEMRTVKAVIPLGGRYVQFTVRPRDDWWSIVRIVRSPSLALP